MEVAIAPAFSSSPKFYASLLQTSLKKTNGPIAGKSVHARIIKAGFHAGVYLMNNVMNFYAKTGSLLDARTVFDEMPVKNIFSWNTIVTAYAKQGNIELAQRLFEEIPDPDSVSRAALILGYSQMGCFETAMKMFREMIVSGVALTRFTITQALSSCAAAKALGIGKKVHSFAVKHGLSSYILVANSLLNMYVKTGDPTMAKIVFDHMSLKSKSSYNIMISLQMQYGRMDLAKAQFDQMTDRDIVSWNVMIAGYNQHGCDLKALEIFSEMMNFSSLKPDKFTLISALSACANLEELRLGKQMHSYIIRADFDSLEPVKNILVSMYSRFGGVKTAQKILDHSLNSNISVIALTSLLDGYIKLGDINLARRIFDSLNDGDVVAWTAMIVGYMQNGFNNDAMELFRSMVREGPKPNSYTLAAMLSVCSSLASLSHGKQIHAAAVRSGEASSVSVGNGLINLYAKAGTITAARLVFNLQRFSRETVGWTSMIIALAKHGLGLEAIELFEKMLALNIRPDHVTYVGVLSACTHIGLVDHGRSYFSLMQNVHKIKPSQSHYACMIDLYGRAGLLQEAQDFIQKMPIEPGDIAWGSLLASCKIYKNVELAKVTAERLLVIDPNNSGAYSSLAGVYSACGQWDDAAIVRKSMRDGGVKKDRGSSWVQVR